MVNHIEVLDCPSPAEHEEHGFKAGQLMGLRLDGWVEPCSGTFTPRQAPEGWFPFGFHADHRPVPRLEFSVEEDEVGDPLWERPLDPELLSQHLIERHEAPGEVLVVLDDPGVLQRTHEGLHGHGFADHELGDLS